MPITQAELLNLYGTFCMLVDAINTADALVTEAKHQGTEAARFRANAIAVRHLAKLAHLLQERAISELMAADPTVRPNPITGHL